MIDNNKNKNKNVQRAFSSKGEQKTSKNFMYRDFRKSNCYGSDFSGSNFDFTSFRGAHFKACNFYGCTFVAAEFVGTNLKKSKFKNATFENALFEAVNLEGTDFSGVVFKNTIFLNTDTSKAKNLDLKNADVKIYEELPPLTISKELEKAIKGAMNNKHIKAARVLDTKEDSIHSINIMRLLESFNEESLIKGLNLLKEQLDKDFCTLSYIVKFLKSYQTQGLI